MQIRVGIKEDDKDVICRAQTELIMSQLKRKNTDITFKKYSIKQEERCNQSDSWLDAVSCAIADGVIDMGITDMKRLMESDTAYIWNRGVNLSAITKRRDARIVLITRKHRTKNSMITGKQKNNKKKAVLYTSSEDLKRHCSDIYADTECVYVSDLKECMEGLSHDFCDGVIAHADIVRLHRYNHIRGYAYDYIPSDIYIPKTGEAVSAVLTSSSLDIVNAVSCISDNNSLKCIDIESSVIHDLMMYGYIQEARAIASIEKDCLTINACIYSHDKSLRMSRSGKLSDSEEIMKKLVSGITGKI